MFHLELNAAHLFIFVFFCFFFTLFVFSPLLYFTNFIWNLFAFFLASSTVAWSMGEVIGFPVAPVRNMLIRCEQPIPTFDIFLLRGGLYIPLVGWLVHCVTSRSFHHPSHYVDGKRKKRVHKSRCSRINRLYHKESGFSFFTFSSSSFPSFWFCSSFFRSHFGHVDNLWWREFQSKSLEI